jgi:hypothetical protein
MLLDSTGGLSASSLSRRLAPFLRSPRFEFALGISVFLIGLAELIEDTFSVLLPSPDVHHALLLLGTVTALRGLVDILEGAEQVAEANLRKNNISKDGSEKKDLEA